MTDKLHIKSLCEQQLTEKTAALQSAISDAQESANSETKSSAGDKHETSRAMAQNERDRLVQQLNNLLNMQSVLTRIDAAKICQQAEPGAYIETEAGNFFISVPLGEIKSGSLKFYAISQQSPVGKSLSGKQVGDSFVLANKTVRISAIS